MLSDCHMHTQFSLDSDADPEEMIRSGISKGLDAVCITDHEDKDYISEGNKWTFDVDEYFTQLTKLREKYRREIDVRIGVEIGLQPHLGEYYQSYTRQKPFDLVIGSVHLIGSRDPYYKEFFEGRSDAGAYEETFLETYEDIRNVEDFDVLGHLDYVTRYGRNQAKEYSYSRFSDIIDQILKYLIEHGKGIELNTAGLKYGLPYAHPHPDVLKRYRELGGEIITVGADAHKPEHTAYDFRKVPDLLKSCGFRYYTEFVQRKAVFKKLLLYGGGCADRMEIDYGGIVTGRSDHSDARDPRGSEGISHDGRCGAVSGIEAGAA